MKSGQGRLILRDGTDVPLEYRIAHQEFGSRCQGSLIGDLSTVNPGIFAERLQFISSDGMKVALLVTNYSDSHLTFIGDYELGGSSDGS